METLRELDIVRALPARRGPLLRSEGDGAPILEVRFSPFDTWYEVNSWWEGNFMERTVKGAFSKTMAEARAAAVMPVKMLFDHGYDPSIGNKPLSAVEELDEEDDSAVARGALFTEASYVRDLMPGLRAGVFGSSFRFRVMQEQWADEPGTADHNPKGLPERTITEVRLFEQGPVTFPASPTATAGIRSAAVSMTDAYYARMRARNPEAVEQLAARATELHMTRTSGRPAAARSTAADHEAAQHHPDEPARSHSGGIAASRRRAVLLEAMGKNR